MIRFRIKTEFHIAKHLGIYRSYAVCAYQQHQLILRIGDVFCERERALAFIRLCNREQPELVHIEDLIEDTL